MGPSWGCGSGDWRKDKEERSEMLKNTPTLTRGKEDTPRQDFTLSKVGEISKGEEKERGTKIAKDPCVADGDGKKS